MTDHRIDLATLTRAQLKLLAGDLEIELAQREHDDRVALEEKVKQMVKEAGFEPNDMCLTTKTRTPRGKSKRTNGAPDHGS